MKRLCLVGMALAGLLSASITTAATAKTPASSHGRSKTVHKTKSVTVKARCKLALVVQPPADDTTIIPGDTGTQFGTAGCGKPLLRGVETDNFTTDDAGNLNAPFTLWLRGGTLTGNWTLTPTGSSQPSESFTTQAYTGKVTIKGGSGDWVKAVGHGTLKCVTTDAVHFSCTESLAVKQKVIVVVKTKKA